jgi:two-component system, NtrC family, nitrogen regulation sensor histidine kinase NtrY
LRGITIIKERSIGLSEFVNNFRNFTQVPVLKPEKFSVQALFNDVIFLLADEFPSRQISIENIVLPAKLELFADRKLIEQVIINLVYNSMDALINKDKKHVYLKAFKHLNNHLVIQVIDNGAGISGDITDKIFIPFFTTKERGSGIGLSFSKQIMQLHGGTIFARSMPDAETIFELTFK